MLSGEFSTRESAVRRASGQVSGRPSGWVDQSRARIIAAARPAAGQEREGVTHRCGGGFTWVRSGFCAAYVTAGLDARFVGAACGAGQWPARDAPCLITRSDRFGKAVRRLPGRRSRHGVPAALLAGSAAKAARESRAGTTRPRKGRTGWPTSSTTAPPWWRRRWTASSPAAAGGSPVSTATRRSGSCCGPTGRPTGSRSSPAAARATSRPMRASSGAASSPRRCAATCSPRPPSMRCWPGSWR